MGIGTAFICWYLLTEWENVKKDVYSPIVPTIASFLIAYIMANIFLSVYDLGCAAILQCFLVDGEVSGGASGKNRPKELEPYFKKMETPPNKK